MDIATTHHAADADGLAALVALHLLESPDVLALPSSADPTARALIADLAADLPPMMPEKQLRAVLQRDDLGRLLVVDTSRPERLGQLSPHVHRFQSALAWDTHPPADGDLPRAPGPHAGACTSVLVQQLVARGIDPGPRLAGLFLVGIHVDTGHFTFPSTSAIDHAAAASCLAWGADPRWPARYSPRGFTAHQLRLMEAMSADVEQIVVGGASAALLCIELPEFEPDLSVLLAELREAEAWSSAVLIAAQGGRLSVIGRSDGSVDMGVAMGALGGGGHVEAASATVRGLSLSEGRALVRQVLREALGRPQRADVLAVRLFVQLAADRTIQEAADLLHRHRINAMPLFDPADASKYVGLATRQEVDAALRHGMAAHPVLEISARVPGWVSGAAPLPEVQRRFADGGGRLLMVGEPGQPPIGVLTRTTVLRAVAEPRRAKKGPKPPRPTLLLSRSRQALGDAWARVEQLAEVADGLGQSLHLIGGAVRDVLLDRAVRDVDLVVEGDAPTLAREVAARFGGVVTVHAAFATAHWTPPDGDAIDLASARSEFYAGRAALPQVLHAGLRQDLYRRDFTVNAMAIALSGPDAGALVDPYGGLADLRQRQLRVLHGLSFHDDPTRAFRAARFAARFDFALAPDTAGLLAAAVGSEALERLSLERLGNELDRILAESTVDRALRLLREWGLLRAVAPQLRMDAATLDRVRAVRAARHTRLGLWGEGPSLADVLWPVIGAALGRDVRAARARLVPGSGQRRADYETGWFHATRALRAVGRARDRGDVGEALSPLGLVQRVLALAAAEPAQREALDWWEQTGRFIDVGVGGRALIAAGVPPGPAVGRGLKAAWRSAWLGGDVEAQQAAALAEAGYPGGVQPDGAVES